MCSKNYWKKIVPFALTFSLGLFVNFYLIPESPSNDFKLNIEKNVHKGRIQESQANRPVRIQQMLEAEFTNRAKENYISGVVRLEVTFLANGQIGKIKVIDALDYGLTESAIQAAKNIKFEPAILNGDPIPINLIIDYTFVSYGQQIAIWNHNYTKGLVWNKETGALKSIEFDPDSTSNR